tara:strand:- start:3463 stop:5004 length:1542 start_codon:yes stop_codon:yes gene_type:complete
MTLAKFARMCEVLENQTPTMKAKTISESMSTFDSRESLILILSQEYPINNIGSKRATTWIANALGVFDDEIETYTSIWGDIGEGVKELDAGNEKDSDITLLEFLSLLRLDCSRLNSDAYTLFSESLNKMSAREKKWFLRYWLHKPRNGVNNKVPLKAMKLYYRDSNIEKYYDYNSASEICGSLEMGVPPECKLTHGQFVNPMLAKARKGKERPTNYIVDIKYDGNRYQIHWDDVKNNVIIFNRKGKIVTEQYPDIVELILNDEVFKVSGVYDTEIYPVNPDGSPAEHKLLGKRVHKKDKAKAVEECPVYMVVFDVLKWNETEVLDEPLSTRVEYLDSAVYPDFRAERFDNGTIQSAYNIAIDRGFEGIMIKDSDMAYQPGKRSKGWLKYKPPRISVDVVITSAKYGEGKRGNVYGTYGISVKDGDKYVSVGKVGTGFSDMDLDSLTLELRKNVDYYEGDTYYFLPRVVLEVTCDLVTNDADGNIGLRFPRCVRIRRDKYPADIDTLDNLMEMI